MKRLLLAAALVAAIPVAAHGAPIQFLGNILLDTGKTVIGNVDVSTSNPAPITCISGCASPTVASTFTPAHVSVTNSATLIAALRAGRGLVMVENTGTTALYLGGSGVTTGTGLLLPGVVGASVAIPFSGAIYGITASGTAVVSEAEVY